MKLLLFHQILARIRFSSLKYICVSVSLCLKYNFQYNQIKADFTRLRKPKTVHSGFTLIELIAVLAIALLVTGVVVVNVGRMPAFISLDNTAHRIQYLFSKASMMAAAQGKTVNVSYSGKVFTVDQMDSPDTGTGLSTGGVLVSERIPEAVDLEFDDEDPKYIFFPDGTGSGTSFNLILKGHSCRIRISPLTGASVIEYPESGGK